MNQELVKKVVRKLKVELPNTDITEHLVQMVIKDKSDMNDIDIDARIDELKRRDPVELVLDIGEFTFSRVSRDKVIHVTGGCFARALLSSLKDLALTLTSGGGGPSGVELKLEWDPMKTYLDKIYNKPPENQAWKFMDVLGKLDDFSIVKETLIQQIQGAVSPGGGAAVTEEADVDEIIIAELENMSLEERGLQLLAGQLRFYANSDLCNTCPRNKLNNPAIEQQLIESLKMKAEALGTTTEVCRREEVIMNEMYKKVESDEERLRQHLIEYRDFDDMARQLRPIDRTESFQFSQWIDVGLHTCWMPPEGDEGLFVEFVGCWLWHQFGIHLYVITKQNVRSYSFNHGVEVSRYTNPIKPYIILHCEKLSSASVDDERQAYKWSWYSTSQIPSRKTYVSKLLKNGGILGGVAGAVLGIAFTATRNNLCDTHRMMDRVGIHRERRETRIAF